MRDLATIIAQENALRRKYEAERVDKEIEAEKLKKEQAAKK